MARRDTILAGDWAHVAAGPAARSVKGWYDAARLTDGASTLTSYTLTQTGRLTRARPAWRLQAFEGKETRMSVGPVELIVLGFESVERLNGEVSR